MASFLWLHFTYWALPYSFHWTKGCISTNVWQSLHRSSCCRKKDAGPQRFTEGSWLPSKWAEPRNGHLAPNASLSHLASPAGNFPTGKWQMSRESRCNYFRLCQNLVDRHKVIRTIKKGFFPPFLFLFVCLVEFSFNYRWSLSLLFWSRASLPNQNSEGDMILHHP